MNIFDSINRNIKNIFVGSHKGEDIKTEWLDAVETEKHQKVVSNPLDSMPIANGSNRYAPPERLAELEAELNPPSYPSWEDTAPSEYEPPNQEWFVEKKLEPKEEKEEKEEEITMHEKMYRMATARYNPFSLGGSENCDSDISCNIGGSENLTRSESQHKNS